MAKRHMVQIVVMLIAAFMAINPQMQHYASETFTGNPVEVSLLKDGILTLEEPLPVDLVVEIGGYLPALNGKLRAVTPEDGFEVRSGNTILKGEFISGPLGDLSRHDYVKAPLPAATLHNMGSRELTVVISAPEGAVIKVTHTFDRNSEETQRFYDVFYPFLLGIVLIALIELLFAPRKAART